MPTYEYQCDACQHRFDQWQSFHDPKLTECPACHEAKLRRLFGSGAAIVFKGSGFYETDYRRTDAEKKAREADTKAPEAKTEAKADAPAAKTEAAPASPPPPAPAAAKAE